GVHGIGGILGAILTGVFAVGSVNGPTGLIEGNAQQLLNQLLATAVTVVFAGVGSFVLLKITGVVTGGLRLDEEDEYTGLDLSQHGESGYNFEEAFPGTVADDEPTLKGSTLPA
ncbi:MAG TPA: hypothetical protein VK324_11585, partial [Tepidisphaeraceae bacterium]|nr:hypothetical protein [Tepidisphaeraceae bacterium]